MIQKEITLDTHSPTDLLGINNSNLKLFQEHFAKLKIVSRGNQLYVNGEAKEIEEFENQIQHMSLWSKKYGMLDKNAIEMFLGESVENDTTNGHTDNNSDIILHGNGGKIIRAKTPNQKKMVELMQHNDILFAIGPAGTGKTYTAVALAVKALKNKEIKRIVLTRPAVEAGENLGFLPGDLKEKIDPYLRPLYDALDDMLPSEKLKQAIENRVIEIAPLAFMRGRTLDNSFIILDEAQNATTVQLKMFLTRLGPSAKCIITGDLTQIDLPHHQKSGLRLSLNLLKDIPGVGIVELSTEDVVRHRIVKAIIKAYDSYHEQQKQIKELEKHKESPQNDIKTTE